MDSRVIITSALFLSLCVFIPSTGSLAMVYGQAITFLRMPTSYNDQTGAFTLSDQIVDGAGNGLVCMTYDYFIFNAQAGQVLQGSSQTNTPDRIVFYMVLNSPSQLYTFMDSNCGVHTPYWPNATPNVVIWRQKMTPASSISWTAPASGQYALVFMANGFYGGVVYFSP